MRQYIFITNQYLPNPGATGLCVHAVARDLANKGNEVHVICYSERKRNDMMIDGVVVHKVMVPMYLRNHSHKIMKTIAVFLSRVAKFIHKREYPLRSKVLVSRFYDVASGLINYNLTPVVVATYTPIEAACCLLRLKRDSPSIKACFYSTDTISNEKGDDSILSAERRTQLGVKWEHKIFGGVDCVLIMECHESYYRTEVFSDYHHKFKIANFPLLDVCSTKRCSPFEHSDDTCIRLVYAGTLYKVLRNPSFLCAQLTIVSSLVDIKSFFMGGGDCSQLMPEIASSSNDTITFLGMQSHETALSYINSADILLSIGNKESPMAPSKIYEYMSTGKPIIHCYSWDNDPCLAPLVKYGNAYLIKENVDHDIDALASFIREARTLSVDEIERIFITSTPDYTSNILMSL